MFNILVMTEEKILSSPPLTTPLLFENLVGGSNTSAERGGVHTMPPILLKLTK